MASQLPTISGVEEGIPSGGVLGEGEQVSEVVKDAKSMQALISPIVQDPEAYLDPCPQGSQIWVDSQPN